MNTARELHSLPVSLASAAVHGKGGSLWIRTARAIKTAWKRLAYTAPEVAGAEIRTICSPVVAKIPAISIAGKHTHPTRKVLSRMARSANIPPARRPGVQGRWKTSDRVATL